MLQLSNLLTMDEILFLFLQFLLVSFSSLIITIKLYKKSRNGRKLPPGPWKLPILGNIHQLLIGGSLPHHALKTLAHKYGPLMHIKLGEIPVVVVSSPKLAREITKENDVAFADRLELNITKILMYNSADIASAPYGDYWRFMRKLCVREFLSHKKVRSFHGLMEDEVIRLVDSVRSSGAIPINLSHEILAFECRIIGRLTVGRGCKDQEPLIAIIKEMVSIAAVFNMADLFPSMRLLHFFSAGSRRRLRNMHLRIDRIFEDIIREHEERRFTGNGDSTEEEEEEEDLVDVFLRTSKRKDLQVPIARDSIKANIFEMFIAGTEASSLVIEWAMSEMMKNPRVLHKAQAEVREVLQGKERFPESHIQKLDYLKMVIKETLRLHPPGPMLCPRRCREETKIQGYDIPINTIVMINVWAIGRDPEFWPEPERFLPERFEDAVTDFHGNHFEFLPFGSGRRICPGIAFGLGGAELFLAHLLFHFEWKIPGGISPEELDMTEKFGATGGRKTNLLLLADLCIS